MTDFIDRALVQGDLVVRGGNGRTVYGLAVPFDREATVDDGFGRYREVFRHGAFTRTINAGLDRVKFLINHDRQRLPIGKAISLREDPAGLIGEFYVSVTREGDDALELVKDGVLDAFSIGFAPIQERDNKGLVERLEVKLRETSLVAFPAYEGALVAGVRNQTNPFVEELERLLALAKNLDTHRTEPAAGTSDDDPSATQDDSVVGHSSRTPTREQRIAALILRGIPYEQIRRDSPAA
jgi:HK97 family phage prohead protease